MKITPTNQSLILATDPPISRQRISVLADGSSVATDAGSVLKSVTIVTLRADYEPASPSRSRFTDEPIDVVATETDAADDPPFDHMLPARIAALSAAPAGTAHRTEARALIRSSATHASFAPLAEYARVQVQFTMAAKGTQLDVHA
jgi:hypothetical protein